MVRRRVVALLTCLVAYAALSGCAPDPPGESGTAKSGGSGDGKRGSGWLSWVPFGPRDGESPTPTWAAYTPFADGKCARLQSNLRTDTAGLKGTGIATAMLALCRAAVDGRADQWVLVEKYATADPAPLGDDCVAALVTEVLARAVVWHKAHPGQKPEVKFNRVEGNTECMKKQIALQTAEPTG
ncbi:hypothetical protein ACWF0M_23450 [Kribbella sp. NPDC055110]